MAYTGCNGYFTKRDTSCSAHWWEKACLFILFPFFFCLVPLKSVEVELEVKDHVATVVSTLNYENKEDKPIEAVFVFPLPGDSAVCHFSATIGQTQIVAEVKEKQQVSGQCRLTQYSGA